jgi:hypothetical protein
MIWRMPARGLVKERRGIRKKAGLRGQVWTGKAALSLFSFFVFVPCKARRGLR